MGIINWIFTREDKLIMIDLPVRHVNAIDTYAYIQNTHRTEDEGDLTRDDVIILALADYMERNLWTNAVTRAVIDVPSQSTVRRSPPRRLT